MTEKEALEATVSLNGARAAMDSIRVIYHHEPEGWWAESPDIEGWYATGTTFEAARALAEEGVPFALGHDAPIEHYVPADERVPA